MPPPEQAVRADAGVIPAPVSRMVAGWGGGLGARGAVLSVRSPAELQAAVASVGARGPVVVRGMGRAYGDAAQLRDGLVLDTTGLKGIDLDVEQGVVTAGAGVTMGELLAVTVPAGWMVPVVPGTQHVSVGGAIAADIHGKNHGLAGSFGAHVEALSLVATGGDVQELAPGDPHFAATVGGMGLTGPVAEARLKLTPAPSAVVSVDTDRVSGFDEALAALQSPGGSYRVAWLDLLSGGPPRGIVTRAAIASAEQAREAASGARATVASRATVPPRWPAGLLRPGTVRAFNELRFRSAPRHARGRLEGIGRHMFPLDALDAWPRLYGPHGFRQYQVVVPWGRAEVLETIIERLKRARVPCFLAVLKDFGPAGTAPLSFPLEGWTLALDLPRRAPDMTATLDSCDELVAEVGGRVYLAKDDRLRPAALRAMYPRLGEWQETRAELDPQGLWCSDLARRTGLLETAA